VYVCAFLLTIKLPWVISQSVLTMHVFVYTRIITVMMGDMRPKFAESVITVAVIEDV